jgi:hypothetical protein
VIRFVGWLVRDDADPVGVVGVVLEEPRDARVSKSANGFFAGVHVLRCAPGYGFVTTTAKMEKSILSSVLDGRTSWYCHACTAANDMPHVGSVVDYLELTLEQLDALVRCTSCRTTRVWYCPHATCAGLAPLEVALLEDSQPDAKGATHLLSMVEAFTCPRCLRQPCSVWRCPQCDAENTGACAVRCHSCDGSAVHGAQVVHATAECVYVCVCMCECVCVNV